MSRRVWVIEQNGEPVACGVDGWEQLQATPGHTLTWYTPSLTAERMEALKALAVLLAETGKAARVTAYSDATRPALRPIFAGRSDGFSVASDWLTSLLLELDGASA